MPQSPRLSRAARQDATIAVAAEVFARHGYHGATTDRIATAAGISQPYVVRMFGTKQELFLLVIQRSLEAIIAAFTDALRETTAPAPEVLGRAYRDLADAHDIHLPLMHAFTLGADPVIGPAARGGFRRLAAFLSDEAGMDEDEVDGFLARGMLINTLLGLHMAADPDPVSQGLVERSRRP